MSNGMDEEHIFHIARRIHDRVARQAYLDLACSRDEKLRKRVEALVSTTEDLEDDFLRPPRGSRSVAADSAPNALLCVGQTIDKYTLLEEVGEGGFGIVWAARQEYPVERIVALKVMKPGLDSKQIVARFAAERQALSIMNHPNVAKVFDAGTTEAGRSYFIMEYVAGASITQYCDEHKIGVTDRLQLFAQVCDAVQHAHQKGIIHRDLKPSNILVSLDGNTLISKVIDFGVAKAIDRPLTENTFHTAHEQLVGTLQYMSPEQAEGGENDVDTRSDIFSLGIVLFELITGGTPMEPERVRTASYAEVQKLLAEEDPPAASARLAHLQDLLPTIAKHRDTDPKLLLETVRGELDCILMKALEKERSRRYQTAISFAEDIRRFLDGDVVLARRPSRLYKFRKLVRRNKHLFATVLTVGVVMLAATVISTWQARQATRERIRTQEVLSELHTELIDKVQTRVMAGDEEKARDAIAQAELAGVSDKRIQLYRGQVAFYFGRPADSYTIFASLAKNSISAHAMLALSQLDLGNLDEFDKSVVSLKRRVQSATALNTEDRIMAAQTILEVDPVFAKQLMEGVLQEKDSPFARLVNALVLASFAQETGDEKAIREALRDIAIAVAFGKQSQLCLAAEIDIQHIAFCLDIHGDDVFNEEKLQRRIAVLKDFPLGRGVLVRYLANVNSERAAKLIKSWATESFAFGEFELMYYIPILLIHESPLDVLAFIESTESQAPLIRCFEARVMSLIPDKHEQARLLCQQLIRDNPNYSTRVACLWTLLFMGERSDVKNLSIDLLDKSSTPVFFARETMELWGGRKSPEELLARAQQTRSNRHAAHFALAGQELSQGQTADGLRHLNECVLTGMFLQADYWWAKSLLTVTKTKPGWIEPTSLRHPTE